MKTNVSFWSPARKSAHRRDHWWERGEESKFFASFSYTTCNSPFWHSSSVHCIFVLAIQVLHKQLHAFTHVPLLLSMQLAHSLYSVDNTALIHHFSIFPPVLQIKGISSLVCCLAAANNNCLRKHIRTQQACRVASPLPNTLPASSNLLIKSWLSQTVFVFNPWQTSFFFQKLGSALWTHANFLHSQHPAAVSSAAYQHRVQNYLLFFLWNSIYQFNLMPIWSVKTFYKAFFELRCSVIMFSYSNLSLPIPTEIANFVKSSLHDRKKLLTDV